MLIGIAKKDDGETCIVDLLGKSRDCVAVR